MVDQSHELGCKLRLLLFGQGLKTTTTEFTVVAIRFQYLDWHV